MIESLGLLAVIVVFTFIGTYEVAYFFVKEREHRVFWIKVWLGLSVVFGVLIWLVLIYYGN